MSDLNGTKVPTLCNQFSIFIPWKAKLFYSLNRIMPALDKNASKIFSFATFAQICACFLGCWEHHIKRLRRPYLQSAVKNHESLIVCAWHTMIVSLPVIVGLNGRYVIVLFSLYSICNILHLIVSSPLSTMTDKVSASHTTNISNPTTVVRVLLSMRTDEGGPEIWGTPHFTIHCQYHWSGSCWALVNIPCLAGQHSWQVISTATCQEQSVHHMASSPGIKI